MRDGDRSMGSMPMEDRPCVPKEEWRSTRIDADAQRIEATHYMLLNVDLNAKFGDQFAKDRIECESTEEAFGYDDAKGLNEGIGCMPMKIGFVPMDGTCRRMLRSMRKKK